MSDIPSSLAHISTHVMQEICHCIPPDFQIEAILRSLMMWCVPNHRHVLLLVQGTEMETSAVTQTVGIVVCDVTLVIEETLALAADQKWKYYAASKKLGPVLAYQFVSIKITSYLKIEREVTSIEKNKRYLCIFYTPPECLLCLPWQFLMVKLLNRGVLWLFCENEIHLFVMFGLTFHKVFCNLNNTFSRHVIDQQQHGSNVIICYGYWK